MPVPVDNFGSIPASIRRLSATLSGPSAYSFRPLQKLHRGTITVLATTRAVGTNIRRRLFGFDAERLGDYAGDPRHTLVAECACGHARALRLELLLQAFGSDARLGTVRQHLRCHGCNRRDPKLLVRY